MPNETPLDPVMQELKDDATLEGAEMLVSGKIGLLPKSVEGVVGRNLLWVDRDSVLHPVKVVDINEQTAMVGLADGTNVPLSELRDPDAIDEYAAKKIMN